MITKPAFDKLTAMGIDLYQLKEQAHTAQYLAINAETTLSDIFFNNVLKAIKRTSAEISVTNSAIDLGDMLWSFSNDETVSLNGNRLVTPPLSVLKSSAQLKKQLWQQLCA